MTFKAAPTRGEGPEAFSPHVEVRACMDALASAQSLPKGTILFRQGEPSRGVYLLRRGKARLTLISDAGHVVPFRTVRAGYVLGLPGTILNGPYLFTAELLERSEVTFIARAEMLAFLRERSDLCFDMVQQLGGDLTEMPPHSKRRSNA